MPNRSNFPYAGFWQRVSPAVFDLVVLGIALPVFVAVGMIAKGVPDAFLKLRPGDPPSAVIAALGKPTVIAIACFLVVASWLYFAMLESSPWQATLGKKFFGLYVTDEQGKQITFWRASRRFFSGRFVLGIPLIGLPYFTVSCLCAGMTSRKQALHDSISGCLVLRKDEDQSPRG
ncbi:MAG: RDD family protein [Candidatus Acidiferrales bacterium]